MQDLLNEKEFLQKPYNPWKVFYIFYAIALIQIVLFLVVFLIFVNEAGIKSILAGIALPNITALVMFFFKRKNALLPIKTIFISTLFLFVVYYLPVIGFSLIGEGTLSDIAIIAGVGAANFLVCFIIMYLVARSKQKNSITYQ